MSLLLGELTQEMVVVGRATHALTIGRAREENCLHQMTSWMSVCLVAVYMPESFWMLLWLLCIEEGL